ncbi:MAG TPA: cytochrome c peroxidase [Ohtaekwangia sp.]
MKTNLRMFSATTGLMSMTALLFLLISCTVSEGPVWQYTFEQPSHFSPATYTFENNPVTREGFELGRMLFYDPVLSADSTVSCSTCHKQVTGFADPTHKINHGINNRLGKRNSPGLANMAFKTSFFYDGGVSHLDFVPINAITSEVEMGSTLDEVVQRLNNNSVYRSKFRKAFGKDAVDSQQMLHALAQFTVMLVSANSKYDKVIRGEDKFSSLEEEGYTLFQSKCSACHTSPMFTDGSFRNNGLDDTFIKDPGREVVTGLDSDRGKFSVPSLRNVELTLPYMHDGRLRTLEDVLNHYTSSVKGSPTLDPLLENETSRGIAMTHDEKQKIIAFLKTLTDTQFINEKRFADPF